MSSTPKLRLDWASSEAARFACKRWHYTGTVPVALVKIGIWEDDKFAGVILFGPGAGTSTSGIRYGLRERYDMAELVRVAMAPWHKTPVSRCIAIATRMLCKQSPNLRMLISFADTKQGHHGGIYQACGWTYLGQTDGNPVFIIHGKQRHNKTITKIHEGSRLKWLHTFVDPNAKKVRLPVKHRYVLPLDEEMRQAILPLAQPYPKRVEESHALQAS